MITFYPPTPSPPHKAQIKYCFGLDRRFWTKFNIPWSTLELSRGLEAWSHGNPTLLLSYIIYLNIFKLADTIRFCFQQRRCIPEGEVVEKYFFHFHAIVHLCSVPRPFVNLSHLFLDWIGPMHSASAYFSSIFPSTFCHGKHQLKCTSNAKMLNLIVDLDRQCSAWFFISEDVSCVLKETAETWILRLSKTSS